MKKLTKVTFLRKLLAIFISIALIVSAVKAYEITHPSTVFAVGDLAVNWGVPEGDPIFTVSNMAPGDTETHVVNVVNNALSPRSVGVRGVKTSETGSLSTAMHIVISQGATDLYGGTTGVKTLAQFFTDSGGPNGIPLSTLGPGGTANYTFKVTFLPSSGNQFQATSVVFDLKIGIAIDLPAACDNIQLLPTPIFGTQNRDVLNGTDGNDLIIGFEGNDMINAKAGNDCVIAGEGNDTIHGQNGNDVIFGDGGNDTIDGHNGSDYIEGGAGDDKINGNNDNDTILGGLGNDDISAENGNDAISGEGGNDDMRGGNNNDTIIGGAGTDKANGENGQDGCQAEQKTKCEINLP